MIIDCISDLHGHYPELEGGDLLIVAGDLTSHHSVQEHTEFAEWYIAQPYPKKVMIAGNHDRAIENGEYYFNHDSLGYLCDSGTEFEGLKIWGSPWTRKFEGMNPKCMSFTCETEEELAEKWNKIPEDTDILITHSPAFGLLDKAFLYIKCEENVVYKSFNHVGSKSLFSKIQEITPIFHIFGHIHESYGKIYCGDYTGINCSHVNEEYKPVNAAVRIIL